VARKLLNPCAVQEPRYRVSDEAVESLRRDDPRVDERGLALHATALAENKASIAMLRCAGFASRSGAGALREFELAVTPRAPAAALVARRENQ
jgi:hypothetical protein